MRLKVITALTAILLLCAGCSGGKTAAAPDLDPAKTAQSLTETLTFRDSLLLMDRGAAEDFYMFDDTITGYAVYASGTGATAEEVAVLKVSESGHIENARAVIDKRVDDLIFRFEDYRPEEMKKLNSPVIETVGNAVILVLSDDNDAARSAIDALKK